jgi:DNA polymerase-3 subunit gamma/tau
VPAIQPEAACRALIAERLAAILDAEGIAFDASALALIAKGARGSMRDALSLLDQAIAYGGGDVREATARTMLGAVDRDYAYRIAAALQSGDGAALIAEADAMVTRGAAFAPALDELASLFHRIAVAQSVPEATTAMDDGDRVSALASSMPAESVQSPIRSVSRAADWRLRPSATGFR